MNAIGGTTRLRICIPIAEVQAKRYDTWCLLGLGTYRSLHLALGALCACANREQRNSAPTIVGALLRCQDQLRLRIA